MVIVTRYTKKDRELVLIGLGEDDKEANELISRDKEWFKTYPLDDVRYTKTVLGINKLVEIKRF